MLQPSPSRFNFILLDITLAPLLSLLAPWLGAWAGEGLLHGYLVCGLFH